MSDTPDVGELAPPNRMLMDSGPSDVHPRVLRAMSTPLVGHLDPSFIETMNEMQELMHHTFRTDNKWTIPASGTGSASMEVTIGNLVEPDDTMLVPTSGYFGRRMESMAERTGGEVVHVNTPWGESLDSAGVQDVFDKHQPDVFGFVHAEASTGVKQPSIPELTSIAHDHDALVVADAVASLGGVRLEANDWGIDVVYSGPQKCLSYPLGANPLTLNDRAMDRVLSREEPTRSWYLDLSLLEGYWGDDRSYHHTAPVTNVYAIRETLRLVAEEGIEERWVRHRRAADALKAGVEVVGLGLSPEDECWLPSLNAVFVLDGVNAGAATDYVLDHYDLEIAGGFDALADDVFRIDCMGHSARPENISLLLTTLGETLEAQGANVDPEAGFATMREALNQWRLRTGGSSP